MSINMDKNIYPSEDGKKGVLEGYGGIQGISSPSSHP